MRTCRSSFGRVLITAVSLLAVSMVRLSAAPLACEFGAISNALATGGDYTFTGGGTVTFSKPLPVAPGGTVTLDAAGFPVTFSGENRTSLLGGPAGSRLVLKGITLVDAYGGAVSSGGDLELWNCSFLRNRSIGAAGDGGFGGGQLAVGGAISQAASGRLWATNCLFADNLARGGFGGNGECGPVTQGRPGGLAYGGAIYLAGGTNHLLTHCVFRDNTARGGEGACHGADGVGFGNDIAVGTFFFRPIARLTLCETVNEAVGPIGFGGPRDTIAYGEGTVLVQSCEPPFLLRARQFPGLLLLSVKAKARRRYHLLESTNLVDWKTNQTRLSPPFEFESFNLNTVSVTDSPRRFFRVIEE